MPSIQLELSSDEALVLYGFLVRCEGEGDSSVSHPAEHRVLQRVSAQLDKALVEPFDANYERLLTDARERLKNGSVAG